MLAACPRLRVDALVLKEVKVIHLNTFLRRKIRTLRRELSANERVKLSTSTLRKLARKSLLGHFSITWKQII